MAVGTFLAPSCIEREINGRTLKFYAASVKTALELRQVAKPILQAFAAMATETFRKATRDATTDTKNEGTRVIEISEPLPLTIEGFKVVTEKRAAALQQLVDAVTKQENVTVFCRLVIDSLRDDYPRGKPVDQATLDEFAAMDVPTATAFVEALAAANASVLGPFAKKIERIPDKVKRYVEGSEALTEVMTTKA